ncbi:MAG: hypothetical protein BGO70_09960 [Bacteroidetes bacterium 43-93]|nr:hypothetical protein [Bacteroidota bacterium]OJX00482.1 MAG: hypothetical protein BGO70_09960 [Bacteroidetes bacterium 43-93]
METENESRFFTFPVTLLRGVFTDHRTVMLRIICFSCYNLGFSLDGRDDLIRTRKAAKYLGVSPGKLDAFVSSGRKMYEEHQFDPKTSMATTIVWDYRNNEKTEFQLASLLAFAAIRSILQVKAHCKTNKSLILARMFGYNTIKAMEAELPCPYRDKYRKRWHMDKLIRELEHNWGLKTFSDHCRGMYVAFGKVDYKTLARVHEERKIKTKEITLRKQKKEALDAARAELNRELATPPGDNNPVPPPADHLPPAAPFTQPGHYQSSHGTERSYWHISEGVAEAMEEMRKRRNDSLNKH